MAPNHLATRHPEPKSRSLESEFEKHTRILLLANIDTMHVFKTTIWVYQPTIIYVCVVFSIIHLYSEKLKCILCIDTAIFDESATSWYYLKRRRYQCTSHAQVDFALIIWDASSALQWRHNEQDSVSNHQPHNSLLNCLFRPGSNKTSNLHVIGLCAGNSPGTGEFPAQMASNAENVSIWWRHHGSGA